MNLRSSAAAGSSRLAGVKRAGGGMLELNRLRGHLSRWRAIAVAVSLVAAGGVVEHRLSNAPTSFAESNDVLLDEPVDTTEPGPAQEEPFEVRGLAAVELLELDDNLETAAANAGLAERELVDELRSDPNMFVTSNLMVGYADPLPGEDDHGGHEEASPEFSAAAVPPDVFALNSRPGAGRSIYLDFNGHVTTNTYWNTNFGVDPIVSAPYDLDGDTSTWSAAERANIYETWLHVSDDLAPFDVNVTTADPGVEGLERTAPNDTTYGTRAVISSSDWYFGVSGSTIGGIAFVDVFDRSRGAPAFVFAGNLPRSHNGRLVAAVVSHEVGHTLGLQHDGTASSGYYGGHAIGNPEPGVAQIYWAPIMGASTNADVSQWSRGEYSGANQTQDDLGLIETYIPYIGDDHGDTRATGTHLGERVTAEGLLGSRTDVDVFNVDVGAGVFGVSVSPVLAQSNVFAKIVVRNSNGVQVSAASPTTAGDWTTNFSTTVAAGTYSIEVAAASWRTPSTGFSSYGSIGRYAIQISKPSTPPTTTPTTTTTTTPTTTTPTTTTTTTVPPTTTTTSPPPTTNPPPPTTQPPPVPQGSRLTPITPARVVDTRSGLGGHTRVRAGRVISVPVGGRVGLPAKATAAVVNVVAVDPGQGGFLTVYPCTRSVPVTSTLNYATGQTVANTTIATLDSSGRLCVYTHSDADVIVDITGWLGASGTTRLTPVGPVRALDTRVGLGGTTRFPARSTRALDLSRYVGAGTTAVSFNITAVNPATAGFMTAYPCGQSRPATSSVNFRTRETRANNAIVGVTNRWLCIFSMSESDVIIDVTGAFGATGLSYKPTTPQRLLDTRRTGMLRASDVVRFSVVTGGLGVNVPAAASVNVAALGHPSTGFVTSFDCTTMRTSSTLNPERGLVSANGAIAKLNGQLNTCAFTSTGGHLVVDLTGWWVQ